MFQLRLHVHHGLYTTICFISEAIVFYGRLPNNSEILKAQKHDIVKDAYVVDDPIPDGGYIMGLDMSNTLPASNISLSIIRSPLASNPASRYCRRIMKYISDDKGCNTQLNDRQVVCSFNQMYDLSSRSCRNLLTGQLVAHHPQFNISEYNEYISVRIPKIFTGSHVDVIDEPRKVKNTLAQPGDIYAFNGNVSRTRGTTRWVVSGGKRMAYPAILTVPIIYRPFTFTITHTFPEDTDTGEKTIEIRAKNNVSKRDEHVNTTTVKLHKLILTIVNVTFSCPDTG